MQCYASCMNAHEPPPLKTLHIYLPDLSGGGAERLHVNLAPFFMAAGFKVTFVLSQNRGELRDHVPKQCDIIALDVKRQLAALPKLIMHLRKEKPDFFISNMEHMNVIAVLAKKLSGLKTQITTQVIACQHIPVSYQIKHRTNWQYKILPWLYRQTLPHADAVIAVSNGVARDLSDVARIDISAIDVVYNGVVGSDASTRMAQTPPHPWFLEQAAKKIPIIIAVGRLVALKDYNTLLRAFARLLKHTSARLMILGEGVERANLEQLIKELGIQNDVAMIGFVPDPLPFMHACQLLVCASKFEGFGNVLAEALACGTPVIATDCPFGPREILNDGAYGTLVPVGDDVTMAFEMQKALAKPHDSAILSARGAFFSIERCAQGYIAVMNKRTQTKTEQSKAT